MAGTTNQLIELVTFKADNLVEIDAATKAFDAHIEEATRKSQALSQSLKSGAYAQHVATMVAMNKQYSSLVKQADLQGLVAQHGKLGAMFKTNEGAMRTLGQTAAITYGLGAAGMMGLVRAGLQGTQEGYRMDLAWQRLSRSVAGIAVPAVEKLSSVVGKVADFFYSMDGGTQRMIMNLALLSAGALAFVRVMRVALSVGGAFKSIVVGIGKISGMGGGSAMGGLGAAGVGAAGAGMGGGLGAGVGAAEAAAAGGSGLGAAGAAAAGAGVGGAAKGGSWLARNAKWAGRTLGKVALPLYAASTVYDAATSGDYGHYRKQGDSQAWAGTKSLWHAATFGAFRGDREEDTDEEKDKKKKKNDRTDVTMQGGDWGEIGSGYERIQTQIMKQGAEDANKKATEDNTEALNRNSEASDALGRLIASDPANKGKLIGPPPTREERTATFGGNGSWANAGK